MSTISVVVGIIKRNDKVLVAKRPKGKPYSGFWEFPGGKIEKNETSEQALQRELREELNIQVTMAIPWFEHLHAYPQKTVNLDMWRILEFAGEPYANEEQVLRWVTFSQLLALRLLEGNYPIMDRIKDLFEEQP